MSGPKLTPEQRYNQFLHSNSKNLRGLNAEKICSLMLKEKLISQNEYEQLKKNPLIFPQYHGTSAQGYENMGLFLSDKNPKPVQTQIPLKQKYTHPQIQGIECDKNGKIDLNQFSLKALKEKYNLKEYDVVQNENGQISVTKKDGTPVLKITKNKYFNYTTVELTHNPKYMQTFEIKQNGELDRLTNLEQQKDKSVSVTYEKGSTKPLKMYELYPDGSHLMTNFDSKTGQKTFQDYWTKDGHSAEWAIEYSNGQPWKKTYKGKPAEYPLVKDLIKGFEARTPIGSPSTGKNLTSDILKRINPENVFEIVNEFKNQTGKSLFDRLKNEYTMKPEDKTKCLDHIEKLYYRNAPKEQAGKELAAQLYKDIQGYDKSRLAKHIGMIDKNNLKYVLTEYRTISGHDNWKKKDEYEDTMNTLREYLPDFLCSKIADYKIKSVTPYQGLLQAIDQTKELSPNRKKELINHIVQTAMEDKTDYAIKSAKKDLANHPTDYHKVEVDIYRLQNTKEGDMRNPELKSRSVTKDSEGFLGTTRKQGQTGDCWLIAAINSVIAKPEMLKKLNELVTYDKNTGNYTVTLKGSNEKYTITADEIANTPNLSTGSKKLKAVEIAMDKHIKNNAYRDKNLQVWVDNDFEFVTNVDINGNWSTIAWKNLFGAGNLDIQIQQPDILKEDFNKPDRLYALSLNGKEDVYGMATSQKDKNYRIVARHAYSIIGSDKENVYLLNPWDSSDKITVSRENLKKIGVNIEQYEI